MPSHSVLTCVVAANEVIRARLQPLNAIELVFRDLGQHLIAKGSKQDSDWTALAAVAREVADQSVPHVTPRWFREEARKARDLDESATLEQCATFLELLHDRYALYGYDKGASWEMLSEYLDWLTLLHNTRGEKTREAVARRAAAKARQCSELKLDAVDAHMRGDCAAHETFIERMHRAAAAVDAMLCRESFRSRLDLAPILCKI